MLRISIAFLVHLLPHSSSSSLSPSFLFFFPILMGNIHTQSDKQEYRQGDKSTHQQYSVSCQSAPTMGLSFSLVMVSVCFIIKLKKNIPEKRFSSILLLTEQTNFTTYNICLPSDSKIYRFIKYMYWNKCTILKRSIKWKNTQVNTSILYCTLDNYIPPLFFLSFSWNQQLRQKCMSFLGYF